MLLSFQIFFPTSLACVSRALVNSGEVDVCVSSGSIAPLEIGPPEIH